MPEKKQFCLVIVTMKPHGIIFYKSPPVKREDVLEVLANTILGPKDRHRDELDEAFDIEQIDITEDITGASDE